MQNCQFTIKASYQCHFTNGLLNDDNNLLANFLAGSIKNTNSKLLLMVDESIVDLYPGIFDHLTQYLHFYNINIKLLPIFELKKGETSKNDIRLLHQAYEKVQKYDLDRHSFIMAIGGGAACDFAGYVAATAHRGINLIRIPTTVLAQNDAAIGVKNGINFNGVKNFLGTFKEPNIVINDFDFLQTLDHRNFIAGFAEAIKIALIKDSDFFEWIETNVLRLKSKESAAVEYLIQKTASLHLDHFTNSGDPFEKGNSRPLDYGHWLAHKIESISSFEVLHGEAVAIGILLDSIYSEQLGFLSSNELKRIILVLDNLELLSQACFLSYFVTEKSLLQTSLNDFRVHLGGELSISLLEKVGTFFNANEIDLDLYHKVLADQFLARGPVEVSI